MVGERRRGASDNLDLCRGPLTQGWRCQGPGTDGCMMETSGSVVHSH